MKHLMILLVLFVMSLVLAAQDQPKVKSTNIFEDLATPDSVSGGVAIVKQDKKIETMMLKRTLVTVSGGFRVQVFSSNTQRTARSEAYKIERELKDFFPDHVVYVSYSAPFWKVRIGDFSSQQDAQELRSEIIKTFPTLRSETYIVRERANQ